MADSQFARPELPQLISCSLVCDREIIINERLLLQL